MATNEPIDVPVKISWTMVDEDGTEKIRACAEHARGVGAAWESLAYEMEQLADSFDALAPSDTRRDP